MKELIELKSLADKINQSYSEVNVSYNRSLLKAKETGDYILQFYSMIPYHERGKHLKKYCPSINDRTARLYIQIAENWDEIIPKIEEFQELSLRKAIQHIKMKNQNGNTLPFARPKVVGSHKKSDEHESKTEAPTIDIPKSDYKELPTLNKITPPKVTPKEEPKAKELTKSDKNESSSASDCSKCPRLINSYRTIDDLKDEIDNLKSYISDIKSVLGEEWEALEDMLKRRKR